ncbi:BsuPI-related putative proteinase inhibitor [Alkaliphilus crotonatoxidans]
MEPLKDWMKWFVLIVSLVLGVSPGMEQERKITPVFDESIKVDDQAIALEPARTVELTPELMEKWGLEGKKAKEAIQGFFKTTMELEEENEVIKINFFFENISCEEQQLYFSSGQKFDIFIHNEAGNEVYRYSKHYAFTQALIDVTLQPGEVINFLYPWDYQDDEGNPVTSGKYTITVKMIINYKKGGMIHPADLMAERTIYYEIE